MSILITGIIIFFISFIFQIVLWRIAPPKKHTQILLILYLGVYILSFLTWIVFPQIGLWEKYNFANTLNEWLYTLLLFVTILFCYLILYSLIEEDSPSFLILKYIDRWGNHGGTDEESLKEYIVKKKIIGSRIDKLILDNMVIKINNGFVISNKGKIISKIINLYLIIVGMENGEFGKNL